MEEPTVSQTRPFADVLLELNKGRVHNEASISLQDLVEAVARTGKKGTLQLSLAISPSKAEGQVEVVADVKVALPRLARPTSIFFYTADHNLTRDNPDQEEMFSGLRDASAEPQRTQEREAQ